MLAGILFPYTRKEMFARSPVAGWKIGPIPTFSVVCFLALAFMVWVFVLLWNDPIAAGHSARSVWSNVGLLAVGAVLYVVMRLVRRRQGVRLELAFKQKPQLIYLLTDGDFPDNKAVLDRIRNLNKEKMVRINTIVFIDVTNADKAIVELMKQIASENGGVFKVVSQNDL